MSNHRTRWKAAQERRKTSGPWLRLDSAEIREAQKGEGYEIVIHGFNLHPRVAPPSVTVGDQQVQDLQFDPEGRRLIGRLKTRPEGQEVTVDYGFKHASCELTY